MFRTALPPSPKSLLLVGHRSSRTWPSARFPRTSIALSSSLVLPAISASKSCPPVTPQRRQKN
eukprot:5236257-Lingulodinium_polyedra.AAC.1